MSEAGPGVQGFRGSRGFRGFRVQGLRFGVWGMDFRVVGFRHGFRVWQGWSCSFQGLPGLLQRVW